MNRSVSIAKRMLTGLLAAAMIVTGMPSYAFAAASVKDINDTASVVAEGVSEDSAYDEAETVVFSDEETSAVEETQTESESMIAEQESEAVSSDEEENVIDEDEAASTSEESDAAASETAIEIGTESGEELLGGDLIIRHSFYKDEGVKEIDLADSQSPAIVVDNVNKTVEVNVDELGGTAMFFFKVTLETGYKIDKVVQQFGDSTPFELDVDDDGETYLAYCQGEEDSVISVITKKKSGVYGIHFDKPEGAFVYAYDADNMKLSDSPCGEDVEIEKGKSYSFGFKVTKDLVFAESPYEIDTVKQGTKTLEPQSDEKGNTYYVTDPANEDQTIKATIKLRTLDSDSFFTLDTLFAEHASYTFTGAQKSTVYPNDYTMTKGTEKVGLVVSYPANYDMRVYISNGSGKTLDLTPESNKIDSSSAMVTDSYSITAFMLKNLKLCMLESKAEPFALTINYNKGINEPVVTADGQYAQIDPESTDGKLICIVPRFGNVTVKASATEGYKLESVELNGEKQTKASGSGMLEFQISKDSVVNISSKGVPTISLDDKLYADNSTVNLISNYTGALRVAAGDQYYNISSVTAKLGNKSVDAFAKVREADKTYVDIDASKAASLGTGTIKVTLTGEDFDTKVISFVVAQDIDASKVSINGFDKNNEVTLKYGADAAYQIKLNKGADFERLDFYSTNDDYFEISKDAKGKPVLKVRTYDDGPAYKLAPSKMNFILKDKVAGKEISEEYTVNVEASALPAPTVKVLSVSDIDMTLSISMPKSVKNSINMYYVITADAADTVEDSSPMTQSVLDWICADTKETIYTLKLTKNNSAQLGDGKAQNYNIAVGAFQVIDDTLECGIGEGERFAQTNILQHPIKYKEVKNQSTKDPYYETKLGLNKKKTSFTAGEKNVLLCTAKFSKKTSYNKLQYANIIGPLAGMIYDTDGSGAIIRITDDAQGVELVNTENLLPGQYTLNVRPVSESNSGIIPATMKFTVKAPVTDITISAPCDTIRKVPGKAVTMKFKAKVGCSRYVTVATKPANSKLRWDIDEIDYNDELKKSLKINHSNGTVTLAKGYVLSTDPDKNKFTVTAQAVDAGEYGAKKSVTIHITNTAMAPASIKIGSVWGAQGNEEPVGTNSSVLSSELYVFDANGNTLYDMERQNDVSISVSPKKGLTVKNGYVRVTKTGTYTIKATSKDGGKKSVTAKFKVIAAPLDKSDPYSFGATAFTNSGNRLYDIVDSEISDVSYIYFDVIPNNLPLDVITDGKLSVNIKGAKKINYCDGESYRTYIKPDKNEVEITVSDRTIKTEDGYYTKTYKIRIKDDPSLGTLTAPKEQTIWTGSDVDLSVEMALKGVKYDKDVNEKYKLVATPYEKDMGKQQTYNESKTFVDYVINGDNDNTYVEPDNNETEAVKATLCIDTSGLMMCPGKKFNCYLTLCKVKVNGEIVKVLTNPVKLTVKVKKGSYLKASLEPKVTYESGSEGVVLKFKNSKNLIDISDFSWENDVVDGKANNTMEKFEIEKTGHTELKLKLKSGAEIKAGEKYSFVIHYICNDAEYRSQRITVTVK